MTAQQEAEDRLWAQIDREKRLDRMLRRVTVAAWTITVALVLAFAVLVGLQVAQFARAALAGTLPWAVVSGSAFPLLVVLGILSALIATLGTVGVFLRLRTASLLEIHARLAALEEILTAGADHPTGGQPAVGSTAPRTQARRPA